MSPLDPRSTLKRPQAHLLQRFELRHIGGDTVETYLRKGFSLAICCRSCERLIEWTPPDLAARFKLQARIVDIAARLACRGEGGCKSDDVVVFPHAYDLPWRWEACD